MIGTLALITAALFQQSPCEALKSVSLPKATIISATSAPAAANLPAHCKVAVTLQPSSDSHIEMELWMPAENWNGKFLAIGNGGWAGNIQTNEIGAAVRRG